MTGRRSALDPVIKFRKYRVFNNGAIREFYSLLRSAMLGARKAGLLHRLVNDQIMPGIMARMPEGDWKQWAKEKNLSNMVENHEVPLIGPWRENHHFSFFYIIELLKG